MKENTGPSAQDKSWSVDEEFHLCNKWEGRRFISIIGRKANYMGAKCWHGRRMWQREFTEIFFWLLIISV